MSFKMIPWGRIGIAVGLLITTALFAAWKIEERRAEKLQAQVVKYQREVGKLREAGREMQAENTRVITRWRTRVVEVDRNARSVENAPLPGNCKTPDIIKEVVE